MTSVILGREAAVVDGRVVVAVVLEEVLLPLGRVSFVCIAVSLVRMQWVVLSRIYQSR